MGQPDCGAAVCAALAAAGRAALCGALPLPPHVFLLCAAVALLRPSVAVMAWAKFSRLHDFMGVGQACNFWHAAASFPISKFAQA